MNRIGTFTTGAAISELLKFDTIEALDPITLAEIIGEPDSMDAIGISIRPAHNALLLFDDDNARIIHIIHGNQRICGIVYDDRFPDGTDEDWDGWAIQDVFYDETNLAFMDALTMGHHIGTVTATEDMIKQYGTRSQLIGYRTLHPMKTSF